MSWYMCGEQPPPRAAPANVLKFNPRTARASAFSTPRTAWRRPRSGRPVACRRHGPHVVRFRGARARYITSTPETSPPPRRGVHRGRSVRDGPQRAQSARAYRRPRWSTARCSQMTTIYQLAIRLQFGSLDGKSAIACDCVPSRLEGHFRAYEHHPETRRSKS